MKDENEVEAQAQRERIRDKIRLKKPGGADYD